MNEYATVEDWLQAIPEGTRNDTRVDVFGRCNAPEDQIPAVNEVPDAVDFSAFRQ